MEIRMTKEERQVATVTAYMQFRINNLGPRQLTSMKKMVRTGVVKGNSAPAMIAKAILESANVGWVHVARYGAISWRNVPLDKSNPLREGLLFANAVVTMEQDGGKIYPWQQRAMDERKNAAENYTDVYSAVYFSDWDIYNEAFSKTDMKYNIEIPETVTEEVKVP